MAETEGKKKTPKVGLYVVDPERKGAAPSKPKDAKDNESQKAYYTESTWKSMPPKNPPIKLGHSFSVA